MVVVELVQGAPRQVNPSLARQQPQARHSCQEVQVHVLQHGLTWSPIGVHSVWSHRHVAHESHVFSAWQSQFSQQSPIVVVVVPMYGFIVYAAADDWVDSINSRIGARNQ